MALKKFKNFTRKKNHVQRKLRKVKNEMNQNNTVIGWLPNFKKIFFIQFFISKRPAYLKTKNKKYVS